MKRSKHAKKKIRPVHIFKRFSLFPLLICFILLSCVFIFIDFKARYIHAQDILDASSIDADSPQAPSGQRKNELHDLVANFSKFPVVSHGDRNSKKIALTFDADMTFGMRDLLVSGKVKSYYEPRVISILRQNHVKATLFLSGLWIEMYPGVTKELAADTSLQLANHSYSHPSFEGYCYGLRQMGSSEENQEIARTQQLLASYGIQNAYFRFPGGCFGEEDVAAVESQGMTPIQWDSAGVDGFNYSKENIVHNVLATAQNGSIIVLHMNGEPNEPETVNALPAIIQALKSKGFEFVTIKELLASQ